MVIFVKGSYVTEDEQVAEEIRKFAKNPSLGIEEIASEEQIASEEALKKPTAAKKTSKKK